MAQTPPFIREDVKNFLAMLAAMNGPALNEMTLEEARASYLALHQLADCPPRDLAVIRDLACPGPGGEIALRLYDSRHEREAGPIIVFFHGGGFVIGDLDTHHALCTEIAAQADLPVIAVDYRRAPEHPFPAAIEDCEAAARWIASSPPEIARKASAIIPMGDSAGGNAAIVVSQALAARAADAPVLLHVPVYPLASDAIGSASLEQFGEGFVLTREAIGFFDAAYQPDRQDPRAFPILGHHEASPPAIVATASLDPIRDSGRDYAAALAQAGVDHLFLEMKGITHSFLNLRKAVPSAARDLERIVEAMRMMLEIER